MKLTIFPRGVATNLREKWSILPQEMNFYKPDRLETRRSFSPLIFDIYPRILPLKISEITTKKSPENPEKSARQPPNRISY